MPLYDGYVLLVTIFLAFWTFSACVLPAAMYRELGERYREYHLLSRGSSSFWRNLSVWLCVIVLVAGAFPSEYRAVLLGSYLLNRIASFLRDSGASLF